METAIFGAIDNFSYPTEPQDAERLLAFFLDDILPGFGDWQDAMAKGEPWMWHSLLSVYLNCGLLDPLDVCRRAEAEWRAGRAPLRTRLVASQVSALGFGARESFLCSATMVSTVSPAVSKQ